MLQESSENTSALPAIPSTLPRPHPKTLYLTFGRLEKFLQLAQEFQWQLSKLSFLLFFFLRFQITSSSIFQTESGGVSVDISDELWHVQTKIANQPGSFLKGRVYEWLWGGVGNAPSTDNWAIQWSRMEFMSKYKPKSWVLHPFYRDCNIEYCVHGLSIKPKLTHTCEGFLVDLRTWVFWTYLRSTLLESQTTETWQRFSPFPKKIKIKEFHINSFFYIVIYRRKGC